MTPAPLILPPTTTLGSPPPAQCGPLHSPCHVLSSTTPLPPPTSLQSRPTPTRQSPDHTLAGRRTGRRKLASSSGSTRLGVGDSRPAWRKWGHCGLGMAAGGQQGRDTWQGRRGAPSQGLTVCRGYSQHSCSSRRGEAGCRIRGGTWDSTGGTIGCSVGQGWEPTCRESELGAVEGDL